MRQLVSLAILAVAILVNACGGSIKGTPGGGTGGNSGTSGSSGGGTGGSDLPPTGSSWSDPDTWPDGRVPAAGEDVTIAEGRRVLLDVSPPALGGLTVNGQLSFAEQDLDLQAKWIMVHGTLQVGSAGRPFPSRATIALTDTDMEVSVMGMGTRGIMVMGENARLELHGRAPSPVWTKLNETSAAGARLLVTVDDVDWREGDELVVAPTDFYRVGRTEQVAVAAADGRRIELSAALMRAHWGVLQYVDDQGPTLTRSNAHTDLAIDERAEVGNLTRNIVIQAPDDAAWQEEGFGAHVMVMYPGQAHVDGVSFRRVGQAGRLARYPFHWHLWSYNGDGTARGDVEGQYIRNSSIVGSAQRCIVIHGTNGATVANNICYDIKGHAVFLEDAVERRNVIENNLVLRVEAPEARHRLLDHERLTNQRGPSGFWLTNPDNSVRSNVAADINGVGFWLSYPRTPLGSSRAVAIEPYHLPFGEMADNVTHSNSVLGLTFDWVPTDDNGSVTAQHYEPAMPFTIHRFTVYKHENDPTGYLDGGALWNRSRRGTYQDFVVADFNYVAFRGASTSCNITGALVVGSTLNNATASVNADAVGVASYHGACQIFDNVFVGLHVSATDGARFGAFDTSDYYTQPVDRSLSNNHDNVLIDTHPGYRFPSPNVTGDDNWALAGALWDPYGYWGAAGNYWVYDLPFFTHEGCTDVVPVGRNGKSCAGPYAGVNGITTSEDRSITIDPLRFERADNGSTWEVPDGRQARRNAGFRHGALLADRRYALRMPATTPPSFLELTVTALEDGHFVVLGVPFTSSGAPTLAFYTSQQRAADITSASSFTRWQQGDPNWRSELRGNQWQPMTAANSLQEVEGSSGDLFWHDTQAGLVWIKINRDAVDPLEGVTSHEDFVNLYRPLLVHLQRN